MAKPKSKTALSADSAILSERYQQYLTKYLPDNECFDPLSISVQDTVFKPIRNERFTVLQIGDGCRNDIAFVRSQSGIEQWIRLVDLETGSLRGVPRRGRIVMGKSSLMGTVAHGIRNGRAFRGR